jgi:hypothetical protein
MKKFSRDYLNSQKNHLSLKARLASEVAEGRYPDLTRDLLYIKSVEDGLGILPHDASLINKPISKLSALKVLMKLGRDDFEMMIVFNMIPSIYEEVLT